MMMTMMSRASTIMIITPNRKRTISLVPISAVTVGSLLPVGPSSSGLGVVMVRTAAVGWLVDSICIGQTGSSRLSRTVLQSLSR